MALAFATLELCAATGTAYVCGLWSLAYGAAFVPAIVGSILTLALFVGAITSGALALAMKRRRRLALVAIVLSFLAFGGFYGGCRKGLHDERCSNPIPGNPECARFW